MTTSSSDFTGLTSRQTYSLGSLIARGGEGAVYTLSSHPGRCAKIYSRGVDVIRAEKLQALIKLNRHQLQTASAWPDEMIVDRAKKPVGFAMPAISGGKPLHLYITPSDRQKHAPNATYSKLVAVSANLARAVTTFHQAGVVLADINFSNFLVLPDATVRIIDCDSVQIGSKAKFRSGVAMEEFVPPELQGKRMVHVQRTIDHDNYGLAVLIFLLLAMGRHPCSGNGGTPIGEAIAARMHPFSSKHSKTCPFCVLGIEPLEIMSSEMRALFKKAFEGGGLLSAPRPSALDWTKAIEEFRSSMVTCSANSTHGYSRTAKDCPWCRIEAQGKPPLFAPTPRARLQPPSQLKKTFLASLFGA